MSNINLANNVLIQNQAAQNLAGVEEQGQVDAHQQASSSVASAVLGQATDENISSVNLSSLRGNIDKRLQSMSTQGLSGARGSNLAEVLENLPSRPSRLHPFDRAKYDKQVKVLKEAAIECDKATNKLAYSSMKELALEVAVEKNMELAVYTDKKGVRQSDSKQLYFESTAIGKFTHAQVKFQDALSQLQKSSGSKDPQLQLMLQTSRFRQTDAMNLYGQISEGKFASEAQADISPYSVMGSNAEMLHGQATAKSELLSHASELLQKLDNVSAGSSKEALESLGGFDQVYASLKNEIASLDGLVSQNTSLVEGQPKLIIEEHSFGEEAVGIKAALQNKLDSLDALKAGIPTTVAKMIVDTLPILPQLSAEQGLTGARLAAENAKTEAVQRYNAIKSELTEFLNGNPNLTVDDLILDKSPDGIMGKYYDAVNALAFIAEGYGIESIALSSEDINHVEQLLELTKNSSVSLDDYIKAGLDLDSYDVFSVLEGKLYGVPLEHIMPATGDLTVSASAGGLVNAVKFLSYTDSNNETREIVFKPERSASKGLSAEILGFPRDVSATKLNIASNVVADMIGCGESLTTTKAICYQGSFGMAMEKASGALCIDMKTASYTVNGENVSFDELIAHLKETGKFETLIQNLSEATCRLEWADVLSGQSDRHAGNYMVSIKEDASVQVVGIDNDMSFNATKTGVARFDFDRTYSSANAPRARHEGRTFNMRAEGAEKAVVVDAASTIGSTSSVMPKYIPEDVLNKLLIMDQAQYKESLRPFLNDEQLESAMSRLDDAINYALTIAHEGKVVKDWSTMTIDKFAVQDRQDIFASYFEKNILPDL